MKRIPRVAWIGSLALAGLILADTKIKKVPISRVGSGEGAKMYFLYCASCHGEEGRGNGPAAKALKIPPTDLTVLAKNNNGEFPTLDVLIMLGRHPGGGGHGSAEMPVWGDVFRASMHGEAVTQLRLYNITRFLEAIQEPTEKTPGPAKQAKPVSRPATEVSVTSGSAMYRSYCASCHGMAGDGNGPMAPLMKVQPTDLTALARIHGGKFPEMYIANVLGLMPGTAVHGSRDMPVWGDAFRNEGEDAAHVQLRIHNLTRYLESIQR